MGRRRTASLLLQLNSALVDEVETLAALDLDNEDKEEMEMRS